MATGTMLAFDQTATLILNGTVNLSSDTIKVSLLDTIPASTVTTYASLSGTLSANLAAQAQTLANGAVSTVATDDAKYDADDIVFTASGGSSTVAGFVIYDDTVTSPADAVLFYGDIDDGAASITLDDGESVTLQFNASGIVVLSDAA